METLQELFEDTIKDLCNAEKQFLKAMPKLAKAAQNESLKSAIEAHQKQSEGHVDRLEQVAKMCGFKTSGKVCKAAQGLVEEAEEHLEEGKPGPVLDAAIVACAQKNEHYEICSYGTVITWAQQLGLKDAAELLKQNLAEEEQTDKLLTQVAKKGVNKEAAKATDGKMEGGAKTASKKSSPAGKASMR